MLGFWHTGTREESRLGQVSATNSSSFLICNLILMNSFQFFRLVFLVMVQYTIGKMKLVMTQVKTIVILL